MTRLLLMGASRALPTHRKAHARVEAPRLLAASRRADAQGCRDLRALRQPTDNHVTVFSEEKCYVYVTVGSWRW